MLTISTVGSVSCTGPAKKKKKKILVLHNRK